MSRHKEPVSSSFERVFWAEDSSKKSELNRLQLYKNWINLCEQRQKLLPRICQRCIKSTEKKQRCFPLHSLLFSLVLTGVRGDSSGQEGVLCCGRGPISDYHNSYECFPADFSSGCCSGDSFPHKHQLLISTNMFFFLLKIPFVLKYTK